ncbi:flavodoxin [Enterococcus faecium]|jgi:flavodoxin|uniref:Flavodoxin n=1 Tax=Enterococcus faecium TaxID=1352 RepID=A0A7V7GQX7_ENTFC|nr:flavodoxin [Enterococcus faecium]KAA0692809.1 flavodoxin [Enterococcus faecium]MBK5026267.1 flavodoxin [Enterococcus faecium]MBK5036988.1 flavodoxin [Enterococcus faecium]MBK5043264.1 flavodoxin [Enterococcus faecium]MBK5066691.1 flavodoxin [Enterococcus faecium]
MKKILVMIPLLFLFAGCRSDEETRENEASTDNSITTTSEVKNPEGDGKTLVAYFSHPVGTELDVTTGASVMEVNGEYLGLVEQTANWIAEEVKADQFRIQANKAYPDDIGELIDEAIDEKDESQRPELASEIENFGQYETIYLGYPIWNGDFPMAFYTFLESYDFAGKTVIPFNVHGGSGLARTVETLTEELPNATVVPNALSISRSDISDSRQEVLDWVEQVQE